VLIVMFHPKVVAAFAGRTHPVGEDDDRYRDEPAREEDRRPRDRWGEER
jgi:hypothetical protein